MAEAYLKVLKALHSHGPAVEISYSNASVSIKTPIADSGITNVAAAVVDFFVGPFKAKATRDLAVISGATGRIRPGTATLIIGNPGGGKTTLLRLLAGRDAPTSGQVLWNGQAPGRQASGANPSKVAAIAPQADVHEPLLTVRETFQFAADSCLARLPAGASPAEIDLRSLLVDHLIDTLGLRECEHVIVGDELKRGISGGQKKRVTLGETLLTGARVLCLDEVTNGLDAATAAEIVQFLVEWSHVTGGTVITALQQVTPEVFRAFDDVILLSNGHELYHGPPGQLADYLAGLSYDCPDYMDVADFALTVCVSPQFAAEEVQADKAEAGVDTTGTGQGAGHGGSAQRQGSWTPPTLVTREALAGHWQQHLKGQQASQDGTDKSADLTGGVQLSGPAEQAQYAVPFVHSSARHMALLVGRQSKLVLRNPAVSFGRIFQFIILASIFGSIYYKIPPDNFIVKFSLTIFACSAVSFASFAEIPAIFISKRTAARQMEAAFYQPLAYVLSIIVNALPAGIISTFLFATILYWMTGFAEDTGRYFFWVLALAAHELAISSLFRLFAFSMPREELAQAAAGITTGTFLVFGGFYIPYSKIPPFMWPMYYLSPFSWTVRSMVNSEFTADAYTPAVAPPYVNTPKGDVYLDSFSFAKGMDWKWGGVAYCLGLFLFLGPVLSPLIMSWVKIREPAGSQRVGEGEFLAAAAAAKLAAAAKASSAETGSDSVVVNTMATTSVAVDGQGGQDVPTAPAGPAAVAPAPAEVVSTNPLAAVTISKGPASAVQALPFTPATLSFRDVRYAVTLPDKARTVKPLLRGVSGYAKPGTMTALMGASGAGKTTLLDVLAFRKTTGAVAGEIRVNGAAVDAGAFSRIAGFAEQEDVHADYATVREAIEFSARLRLPSTGTAAQRRAFVSEVLALLELQPLEARRTGSLSQGERKRLTIGVELAANPAILFLDEPTTGLDARSAAVVMRVIRNIATTGRTVVATIHQPSAEVFFAFDALLCLVPGGYQTFLGALHGPHKRAEKLVAFLQDVPGVAPLPHATNPATWMLEQMSAIGVSTALTTASGAASPGTDTPHVAASAEDKARIEARGLVLRAVVEGTDNSRDSTASTDEPTNPAVEHQTEANKQAQEPKASQPSPVDLPALYKASQLAVDNEAEINTAHNSTTTNSTATGNSISSMAGRPGFFTALSLLYSRMMLYMWRNTLWNGLRLFVFVVLSLFFGLLYLRIDDSDQAGVFGKIAVALNSCLFVSIISLNTGIPNYARLRAVFYRERAAGFYASAAYPLSLILTELPWNCFFVLVYLSINYFLVGFNSGAGPFFTAYLGTLLTPWWFAIIGMGFIAFFPFPLLANIFGGLTIQLSILFAGVQLSVGELPSGWRWMYYSDGFAHALRLCMLPQYEDDSGSIRIVSAGVPVTLKRQAFVESRMGTEADHKWEALGWLVLIVWGAAFLASLFYIKVNHQKR